MPDSWSVTGSADPLTACDNAIEHYTRLRTELLEEVAKYQRKANEKQAEAVAVQRDVQKWIEAKNKLEGNPVLTDAGSDSNIGVGRNPEAKASDFALLPARLPQQAYEEYQRAYHVHSGNPDHPFLRWAMLESANKSAWRSVTGLLMAELAKHNKPAIALNDSSDMARSAYEAWQQQFGYPTRVTGDIAWSRQSSVMQRRWIVVVETIKELLKNNRDTANLALRYDRIRIWSSDRQDFSLGIDRSAPVGIVINVTVKGEKPTLIAKNPLDDEDFDYAYDIWDMNESALKHRRQIGDIKLDRDYQQGDIITKTTDSWQG